MANIVVTTTTSRIDVVFNDTASAAGVSHASLSKASMQRVSIDSVSDVVVVSMADGTMWRLGVAALPVDSVDATTITDTASLYSALKALM